MTLFIYFPAVSDVNVILSKRLFSHVAAYTYILKIPSTEEIIVLILII